jgi:serine protease Do
MKSKKWLMVMAILVVVAAGSLYLKGKLVRSEATLPDFVNNPRQNVFSKGLPSLSRLVKDTKTCVVNISTTTVVKSVDIPGKNGSPLKEFFSDDLVDRFFRDTPTREFKQRSLGSGFIIDKEGYILTNNHVVEKASVIKVTLSDDKEYDAKVVGKDAKTDIALIKINTRNSLPVASLGDSDKLEVGDWVFAVGNPYGLDHTVTAGIVSAKGRAIGQGPYDDFIQTDASINPGNSGGPLFNLQGEVIGINTAIFSGGQGIGFALPIKMVKTLLPQLKSKGKVVRGWLGVVVQKVTPELARNFALKGIEGALISDIVDNSPAAKSSLRRGDVIISVDGKAIKEMEDLPKIVAQIEIGNKAKIGVIREGRPIDIDVIVAEAIEEIKETPQSTGPEVERSLGLIVQNITPEIARYLNMRDRKGVIVTDIQPGSPAEDGDLRPGDIIREINRKLVSNVTEFRDIVKGTKSTDAIVMLVKRDNLSFYAVVREGKKN